MKTQYYTASSLDGFVADSENSLDWLLQFGEPAESYPKFIKDIGVIVMGSTTYEWLLEHEINKNKDQPKPWPYEQPAWVFSTRNLFVVPNADIRFVKGDVKAVYQDMVNAAQGKNIWVVGGGDLAGQFFDQGLLDELIITITPVTLGSGAPLLPRRISNPPLKLLEVKHYGDFYAELRYEVVRD
ncbi:MAG: deaminase [Cyanobacteria bacterium DS2.3.42]|nr:deaminase [Cyanobacteria bacterium DS2.3.42]